MLFGGNDHDARVAQKILQGKDWKSVTNVGTWDTDEELIKTLCKSACNETPDKEQDLPPPNLFPAHKMETTVPASVSRRAFSGCMTIFAMLILTQIVL